MSKKSNWALVDKRIRARKTSWTAEERNALEAGLKKLPDLSEQYETVDLPQPAVGTVQREDDEPATE